MTYENEYWEAQAHINELEGDNKGLKSSFANMGKVALVQSEALLVQSEALADVAETIVSTVDVVEELVEEGIRSVKGDG